MTVINSVYGQEEAEKYDKILSQPVYKYYAGKKLSNIKRWLNNEDVVLDLGCGTGVYASGVSSNCGTVVGLDASANMVRIGLERAKKQGLKNVHFLIGNASSLPFRDGAFDAIFEINLIHHIADEKLIAKGLADQQRCIKHGGHILIIDLNANSFGWSQHLIPKTLRSLIYVLLYPLHEHVEDNDEEGTQMVDISKVIEKQPHITVLHRDLGGFIPTYCPQVLFKLFVLLEKIMESSPLLQGYGAHSTIVGQVQ